MIKRGDVFIAQLDPVIGNEQGGTRPVVIVQNDTGNEHSTTVVAAITGKCRKMNLPTRVKIDFHDKIFSKPSVVMLDQLRTLDKSRLVAYMGSLNHRTMRKINKAILISVGVRSLYGGSSNK